jgi:hypothetical protein
MRNPLLPLSVLLFLLACSGEFFDIRVEQLSCEYQAAPLAIDSPNPSLSWVLTGKGKGEGQVQNAYEILVALNFITDF